MNTWTADQFVSVGVETRTAGVLAAHLQAIPTTGFLCVDVLMTVMNDSMDVGQALDLLDKGLDRRDPCAAECTDGDGTGAVILIGRAIGGTTLADMRLPEARGGHAFVRGLLDCFDGRTAPDATGIANVVSAMSIVLDCGAPLTTDAFDGVPPLIYALSRGVPAPVLDVLLRHGADPNEPLSCEGVSGPACGLDYVVGGTAMHHAALAGRGDAMKVFFITHGGRLDAITRDGYEPMALAGASTHRTFGPRYGLIENTLSALHAWIETDEDNTRRRANGEQLCEVLATRLLELGRSVNTATLHHWLGAMTQLVEYGCDVASVLYRSPSQGGASYVARIRNMMRQWYGDNSRAAQALNDGETLNVAGDVDAWIRSLAPPASMPRDGIVASRCVMRATHGPLFGDIGERTGGV
ncbi:ankyrin repeat domain-containing protein [Pandoraea sp. ISTKB]|uniref:ankyrin repeat domain-containing protein n=1 Tax=Pandoraea sp. ISTKB TaxID=1586708 RepID=UPI0008466782|nr:ankyrin repeat domain-containing protein [Pandoraea sp. ISTKB]ODP35260.1 hypothetical protein A9762_11290 [Pandoraea sp. ISTKB]